MKTVQIIETSWSNTYSGHEGRYSIGLVVNLREKVAYVVCWFTSADGELRKEMSGNVCPCCTNDRSDIAPLEAKLDELKSAGAVEVVYASRSWSYWFREQGRAKPRHEYKHFEVNRDVENKVFNAIVVDAFQEETIA